MIPADQAEVAALLQRLAGRDPVETHISAIFRGSDAVWKLKKSVRLRFLDFSEPDRRRHFLQRELALNAPFVPGLYRDVVPVCRSASGVSLEGEGEVVDWVLRMAVVPEGDFMDEVAAAGRLDSAMLGALADVVAAMHAAQDCSRDAGPVARMRGVVAGNAAAAGAAGLDPAAIEAWQEAMHQALDRAAPLLHGRGPLVRRAHGDLHLGNLLLWQGRPAPFDALEFDEGLATIDPGYDLAFLLMDLDQRVSRAAANLVLCRYVARTGDAGLVGALPPFLSLRALVRAHVEAARGRDGARLLAAAEAYLVPRPPGILLAVGGLMGTGKSTLARAIAPGLGPAPGALVLRSDEQRKRLHGVAPEMPLPDRAYGPEANRRADASLLELVRDGVRLGHAVIVDATMQDPGQRQRVRAIADQAGAAFLGIWLDVPLPELERRILARHDDASDATVDVLRQAAARVQPPEDWVRVDGSDRAAAQQQVQALLAVL